MFVIHYIEPRVFPNTKLHFLRVCITSAGAWSELLWAESETLLSVRNITAKLVYLVMLEMQVFWSGLVSSGGLLGPEADGNTILQNVGK